jgi:tetratricopeptide (TPR) repeat protein
MHLKFHCLSTALALLLAVQSSALAQTPPPDPTTPEGKRAEGKARYEQGADAYAKGRFTDAIDLFLQADALAPSAALSFNIARAYEKIGDDALALRWYRDFRRRAPDAKNGPEVDVRIHELELALAKKGVQQLTVMSSPQGATVTVDDQPVGVTPFTGQFPPGRHRVVISLKGYAETAQELELPADRAQDLNVPLVPATRGPGLPPVVEDQPVSPGQNAGGSTPNTAPDRPSGPSFGIWPWVGLGAGALTLGAAGGFELARRSAEDDAREDTTQVGRKEKLGRMTSRQSTARVLGVVGGALVVTSGVFLAIDLSSGRPRKQTSAVALDCLPGSCAVTAWGSF